MSAGIVPRTPKSEVFSESLEINLKYPFTRTPMETILNEYILCVLVPVALCMIVFLLKERNKEQKLPLNFWSS